MNSLVSKIVRGFCGRSWRANPRVKNWWALLLVSCLWSFDAEQVLSVRRGFVPTLHVRGTTFSSELALGAAVDSVDYIRFGHIEYPLRSADL